MMPSGGRALTAARQCVTIGTLTIGRGDIERLRELYREGRAAISALPDPIERELGLAALRLEATHTYKQLVTTARGLNDQDVVPLKEYVESLAGGELPERVLSTLDQQAEKQAKNFLSGLWMTLASGVAVGAVATVVGFFSTFALTAEQLGAAIFTFAIAGGSALYFVIRAAHAASIAGQQAWLRTWGWAASLGQQVDVAMAETRRLQAELWSRAAAGPWTYQPLTAKARSRAKLLVGAAWALLAFGVVMTAIGFAEAANEWYQERTRLPIVPTSP